MQNYIVVFTFSNLNRDFLGKFGLKNQNFRFNLKFGTKTNLNMQNSMVKIVSLSLKFGTENNSDMQN